MLVRPHDLISNALHNHFAIGAFNTSNLELTQAIVSAAQEKRAPVIVETSEGAIKYAGLEVISSIVSLLAKQVENPVILHLDHGKSLEIAQRCIKAGYTSVMIDASRESYKQNIVLTKRVVDYAHERGVWVEAELGSILGAEGAKELKGGQTPDEFLTDPKQAHTFIQETGVDALAVSVGTIHGAFTGQEYLRFELIKEIEKEVPGFPLVLHGASGIADDHLRDAAVMNICKVNVDTEMRIAFEKATRAYFDEPHDKVDPRDILGPAREAVQQVVENKIQVLGSAGKV